MKKLYSFFMALIVVFSSVWAVGDDYLTKIEIFPSGQGNCVLVRYNHQAILIDAGSSEMHFPAAYEKKAKKEIQEFTLEELEEISLIPSLPQLASTQRRTSHAHQGDSTESSSTESSSGAAKRLFSEVETQKKSAKDRVREKFKQHLLDSIQECLCTHGSTLLQLKTLVITHADEDHYNLVSDIFSQTQDFSIENVILGGFHADYNQNFKAWLNLNYNGGKIRQIIVTGMADGSRGPELGLLEEGLARAYYSGMADITPLSPVEEAIETALQFMSGASESPAPRFEILSMNAGHATESNGRVRRANDSKNANSLVLRLVAATQSIIFSGDAEISTWRHIAAHTWSVENHLTTDYLLLSHHGSKEEGATHQEVLNRLQPKACFISAGRHLGYHHPHQETIDLLMSLASLQNTTYHDVSYFGPDRATPRKFMYRRKSLEKAVFSTLNSGILSLTLGEEPKIIRASQSKERIYKAVIEGGEVTFGVNYAGVYCLEEGQAMEAAIADLVTKLDQAKINLTLWQLAASSNDNIDVKEKPIQNAEYEAEFHVLVKDEKKRFYFLEQVE